MIARTPGPWYVGHDAINPLTGDATLSVGPTGITVAAVQEEADARLIAAAPFLEKTLRDILEEAEEHEDTEDCGEGRVQANAWMIVASLCREALDAAGVSHA